MSPRIPHLNPELDARPHPIGHLGFRRLLRLAPCLTLAFLALSTADAQITMRQIDNQGQEHVSPLDLPSAVDPANFQAHRIRELNIERQKELVSDTNNLLRLTTQLNAEVAKDGSSSLTSEQVRMLAKIEKLAKSVREKMSNPVQTSIFENNYPPPLAPPVPVR